MSKIKGLFKRALKICLVLAGLYLITAVGIVASELAKVVSN